MTTAFPSEQGQRLLHLLGGYRVSQALYVAVTLDLAGLVASGPRSSEDLAAATSTHAPSLYRLLRVALSPEITDQFRLAQEHALDGLRRRIARVEETGGLGMRTVRDAVTEFHALCEGLAALELRCVIPGDEAERIWRDGLSALVQGWRAR